MDCFIEEVEYHIVVCHNGAHMPIEGEDTGLVPQVKERGDASEVVAISQLMCVVNYGDSKKGLLVVTSTGDLKILPFDRANRSVKEFLKQGIASQQTAISPDDPAYEQYWAMLGDSSDRLAAIALPHTVKTIRASFIDVAHLAGYTDFAFAKDLVVFKVLDNASLGSAESYRMTVAAFAQGLAATQLSESGQHSSLVVPITEDQALEQAQARLLVVGITDRGSFAIDHASAAGTQLLRTVVTLLMHDVDPREGGTREPYIGNLIENCHITPEQFIDSILTNVMEIIREDVLRGKGRDKPLPFDILHFFQIKNKLRNYLMQRVLEQRNKNNLSDVDTILNIAAEPLDLAKFVKPASLSEQMQADLSKIRTKVVLSQMLNNALLDSPGNYFRPAEMLHRINALGDALVSKTLGKQSPEGRSPGQERQGDQLLPFSDNFDQQVSSLYFDQLSPGDYLHLKTVNSYYVFKIYLNTHEEVCAVWDSGPTRLKRAQGRILGSNLMLHWAFYVGNSNTSSVTQIQVSKKPTRKLDMEV